ncbi:MAG: DNA topoisomerase VI subunit B [Archaeoglobaceae archaeon]|nr:DNA topoisomerase VI subunit B [Archaeoglobaceae archaeon]MDW7989527.1 DNA topoisomerase VI subunit B [Archaeoglobaceae archaeon]
MSELKEISIAEFFEKNKHILGYTNPAKALITVVKEAVDNSLDACEERGILPDILVRISSFGENFRIVVEDNGPGIKKEFVARAFGKLLYGSRFYEIRQSRGQQGIGISGAVLYAQLTTGKPVVVLTKTFDSPKAYRVHLYIDTKRNEPVIEKESEEDWYLPHGTRVELEIYGSYVREKKQSVLEYLKETSVINPHAKITFVDPEGKVYEFKRSSNEIPKIARAIKPHPHGIELGKLMAMLKTTNALTIRKFLKDEFVRVGDKIADEIIKNAGFSGKEDPKSFGRLEAQRLLEAFKKVELLPPPTDCLSPIGEELLMRSILQEYSPEFVFAVTRKPKVYSGHPFFVEVAIAYGGEIKTEKVTLLRFANKIPLLYQQGGCAITKAVESVNWKNYGLEQNRDELPMGNAIILVHLGSTNIPYTSESKEAIAMIPEIVEEVKLGLQEVGRKLKEYIDRKSKQQAKKKKEEVIVKILPLIARKICEVLEKDSFEVDRIVARIMGYLHFERAVLERDGVKEVTIKVYNFTKSIKELKVIETCEGEVKAEKAKIYGERYSSVSWDISIAPNGEMELKYFLKGRILNKNPIVEGIDPSLLSGAISTVNFRSLNAENEDEENEK